MAEDDVFPAPEPGAAPAPEPPPEAAEAMDDDAALDLPPFFSPEPLPSSGDALAAFLADLDVQMATLALPAEPAASPDPKPSATAGRYVIFRLGEARYALPLEAVLEMTDMPAVTPVPFVPDWVLGVTNLRGDILAVLDLAELCALPANAGGRRGGSKGRLLVTRNDSGNVQAGLLVDGVDGIAAIPSGELAPPGPSVGGKVAAFLAGVGERDGRLLALLDPDAIFASPEVRKLWHS
jgi:purine-binding chemotaxis protein CheW